MAFKNLFLFCNKQRSETEPEPTNPVYMYCIKGFGGCILVMIYRLIKLTYYNVLFSFYFDILIMGSLIFSRTSRRCRSDSSSHISVRDKKNIGRKPNR